VKIDLSNSDFDLETVFSFLAEVELIDLQVQYFAVKGPKAKGIVHSL